MAGTRCYADGIFLGARLRWTEPRCFVGAGRGSGGSVPSRRDEGCGVNAPCPAGTLYAALAMTRGLRVSRSAFAAGRETRWTFGRLTREDAGGVSAAATAKKNTEAAGCAFPGDSALGAKNVAGRNVFSSACISIGKRRFFRQLGRTNRGRLLLRSKDNKRRRNCRL